MNGIIAEYSIDIDKFKVGDCYQFHQTYNSYINAILIKVENNRLTFRSINNIFYVEINEDSFTYINESDERIIKTTAHFRKLTPSYDKLDEFNWK